MKRLLLLLALCPSFAWGAAYTATTSGQWGTAATWGGSGVPGNNDTATIPNGIVVTSSYTVTVGTSPAGGAAGSVGTDAVKLTGTGQLIVGTGTFTTRGDIEVNGTGNVTLEPGTTLQFDSSQASSPSSQHYRLNGTNTYAYDILIATCTAVLPCKVISNASGGAGYIDNGAINAAAYGGGIYAHYVDFESIGDATHYFDNIWTYSSGGSGNDWNVQYSTFNNCGVIEIVNGIGGPQIFLHENNIHTNTLSDTPMSLMPTYVITSGARDIGYNVFDKQVGNHNNNQSNWWGFNIHDNYFGGGFTSNTVGANGTSASFMNNVVHYGYQFAAGNNYSFITPGSMINNYFIIDASSFTHTHFPDITDYGFNLTFSSNVWETAYYLQYNGGSGTENDGATDPIPAVINSTFTFSYNLEPCGASTGTGTNFYTIWMNDANMWYLDHNTACAANSQLGSFQENYSGPEVMNRGAMTDNIWYDQASENSSAYNSQPSTSGWTNEFNPNQIKTNANYNIALVCSDPLATNNANGYCSVFSSTPGPNDFTANPQFYDSTRHWVTFDSAYLVSKGLVPASTVTWSAGGSYQAGEIVSDSSGTFFGGSTINYRCLVSTDNAQSTIRPGVTPNSSLYWEFATAYDLRNAVSQNLTITDSQLGLTNATYIQALIAWEKYGYQPTNVALHSTGYDGKDIGSQPYLPSGGLHLSNFWVSDGGYKQPRQDAWPTDANNYLIGTCETCTISRNWDGTTAKTFSGKNETVSLVLYMANITGADSTDVTVQISTLTGTDSTIIPMVTVSSSSVWNTTTRPIQEFYVRYLQILGISIEYPKYEQRVNPTQMRVPCTLQSAGECYPNDGTTFANRSGANKFYPDILVPYEELQGNGFTVSASSSQAVWFDIYVSSTLPAETYTGTITVKEGVNVSTTIPVQLIVYNATLPQTPSFNAIAFVSGYDIYTRHYNNSACTSAQCVTTYDHYAQMFKAHGLNVIGDAITAQNYPTTQYANYLSGNAFTKTSGYGNARGQGLGLQDYSIGTYDGWQSVWSTSSVTNFCTHVSSWGAYFKNNYPSVRSWVYLQDEPPSLTNSGVPTWSEWISTVSYCQTAPYFVNSLVTQDLPAIVSSAPYVTQPTSTGAQGVSSATWQADSLLYQNQVSSQAWRYNAEPPGLDDGFATEEDGVGPRQNFWACWKKGAGGYYIWEATQFQNSYDNLYASQDLFNQALTFGTITGTDSFLGQTGADYYNGDGVLVYPGTDVSVSTYTNYGFDGPIASWRLKMIRRGIQDVDYLTMAYAVNPSSVTSIVQNMMPQVIWDYQCYDVGNPSDCNFAYGNRSWPSTAGTWETEREALMQLILTAGPPSATILNGYWNLKGSMRNFQ